MSDLYADLPGMEHLDDDAWFEAFRILLRLGIDERGLDEEEAETFIRDAVADLPDHRLAIVADDDLDEPDTPTNPQGDDP